MKQNKTKQTKTKKKKQKTMSKPWLSSTLQEWAN